MSTSSPPFITTTSNQTELQYQSFIIKHKGWKTNIRRGRRSFRSALFSHHHYFPQPLVEDTHVFNGFYYSSDRLYHCHHYCHHYHCHHHYHHPKTPHFHHYRSPLLITKLPFITITVSPLSLSPLSLSPLSLSSPLSSS